MLRITSSARPNNLTQRNSSFKSSPSTFGLRSNLVQNRGFSRSSFVRADKEILNGWDVELPDETYEVVEGKPPTQVTLSLTVDQHNIINRDKVEEVKLQTDEGEVTILPGHFSTIFQLTPSVLEIKYNEKRTEKYFTAGGFAYIDNAGPVDINTHDTWKLDEFDPQQVQKELDKNRELAANPKNERQKVHAQVAIEVYEELSKALNE
eukprot:gb/GECH01011821.1/.p1 GENE.gb/GECH01011821.1/~~gb/GECH01011821.1/.p1  ORF type:complete len:207 (+),score=55.80 gb/GECH01011821.1/:1-621(+)